MIETFNIVDGYTTTYVCQDPENCILKIDDVLVSSKPIGAKKKTKQNKNKQKNLNSQGFEK